MLVACCASCLKSSVISTLLPEVQVLLAALTASGLPHYDRAFLAQRILKLLKESANSKTESTTEDTNGIPF